MYFSHQEIKEQFPDMIAEIWPLTRMKINNRENANERYVEVPVIQTIQICYYKPLGTDPVSGEIRSQPINVTIGPFQEGTCIRTDKIPGTKAIPPIELLKLLLEHDGYMDDFGNIKNFELKPVDPRELELEKKALADPEVRKQLDDAKREKAKPGEIKVGVEKPVVDKADRQRRGVKVIDEPPPVPDLEEELA